MRRREGEKRKEDHPSGSSAQERPRPSIQLVEVESKNRIIMAEDDMEDLLAPSSEEPVTVVAAQVGQEMSSLEFFLSQRSGRAIFSMTMNKLAQRFRAVEFYNF
jgi:hypothetical protein